MKHSLLSLCLLVGVVCQGQLTITYGIERSEPKDSFLLPKQYEFADFPSSFNSVYNARCIDSCVVGDLKYYFLKYIKPSENPINRFYVTQDLLFTDDSFGWSFQPITKNKFDSLCNRKKAF